MISNLKAILFVLALLVPAASASAELRNFQLSSDGKQCLAAESRPVEEPGRLVVVLAAQQGMALSEWALTFTGTAGAAQRVLLAGNPLQAAVDLTSLKSGAAVAVTGKVGGADVSCAEFLPAQAAPAGAAPGTNPADRSLDRLAMIWFASADGQKAAEALKQQVKERLQSKDVTLLPHLPSGNIAAPYPASIAETTDLQIVLIVDRNETKLRVLSISDIVCPERDGFRILGTLTEFLGAGQSSKAPDFALIPADRLLECGAGLVKYTAQMNIDGTPSGVGVVGQVRLRPIYQLAATAAVGFDTANPPTAYPVVNGKVGETRTRVGSELYVGFVWYPGGIDYERVTAAQRVAPFVLFDPEAIKEHFIVGGAVTAKGRISIAIGLSVHKFDVPDGTAVGADFTGEGEVKTKKDWGKKGLGAFIGVSFNVAEFMRVKNTLTAQK